jgi:predicted PhzF superfamily epimerase YddE/YHI9
MKRPSEVHISVQATGDKITRVQIGGSAVTVSRGSLLGIVDALRTRAVTS